MPPKTESHPQRCEQGAPSDHRISARPQLVDTYRSLAWQGYGQQEPRLRRQGLQSSTPAHRFPASLTIRMCQGGADEVCSLRSPGFGQWWYDRRRVRASSWWRTPPYPSPGCSPTAGATACPGQRSGTLGCGASHVDRLRSLRSRSLARWAPRPPTCHGESRVRPALGGAAPPRPRAKPRSSIRRRARPG